jgi:hypothetical protein
MDLLIVYSVWIDSALGQLVGILMWLMIIPLGIDTIVYLVLIVNNWIKLREFPFNYFWHYFALMLINPLVFLLLNLGIHE